MAEKEKIARDFVEALCLYVEAMNKLNKQYIKAVDDINEMFNRRMEGMQANEVHHPLQ